MRRGVGAGLALATVIALAGCGPSDEDEWREIAREARAAAVEYQASDAQLAVIDASIERGTPPTHAEVDTLWPAYEACLLSHDIAITDLTFESDYPGVHVKGSPRLEGVITLEVLNECSQRTHWFALGLADYMLAFDGEEG